jgi:hypothetical protein
MELYERRVTIAVVITEPTGRWVEQLARGLVDGFGGVLAGKQYLLHDRATVFTENIRHYIGGLWCGNGEVAGAIAQSQCPFRTLDSQHA